MQEAFGRLRRWLEQNHPAVRFNPPASKAEIERAEKSLALEFPRDLREYLALANGEDCNYVIGNWQLMDLKWIVKTADRMRKMIRQGDLGENVNEATPYVRGMWWNPRWIPIVDSESGHNICIDLDPNEAGTVGQIVLFLHDDEKRPLVAHSLAAWFARLADDMERGIYRVERDEGDNPRFNSEALMWSSLEARDLYQAPPS